VAANVGRRLIFTEHRWSLGTLGYRAVFKGRVNGFKPLRNVGNCIMKTTESERCHEMRFDIRVCGTGSARDPADTAFSPPPDIHAGFGEGKEWGTGQIPLEQKFGYCLSWISLSEPLKPAHTVAEK